MFPAAASIPEDWDRAVAYGDGIFETLLILDGHVPLWPLHRQRLLQSIRTLQLHADIETLEQDFLQQVIMQGNGIGKIMLARYGGLRGYDPRSAGGSVAAIRFFPLPSYARSLQETGVRLQVCRQRLASNPVLAGIKHLNRLEQVMAAAEIQREWADEGLMLDASGSVIECTSSNIFLLQGRTLHTPSLHDCGVAGVMRSHILQTVAPSLGLAVDIRRVTLAQLLSADAVIVCNSIVGIRPVCSIGVSSLPAVPAIVREMQASIAAIGYARLYG